MGYLSEILSRTPRIGLLDSPFLHNTAESKQATSYEKERQNLLDRPDVLENRVSAAMSEYMPTAAKPKYNKFGNKTDAMDALIPDDHPFKGSVNEIKTQWMSELSKSTGTNPEDSLRLIMDKHLGNKMEAAFEYKAKADSSIWNQFGLFGEDKSLRKINDPLYDKWKEAKLAEQKAKLSKDEGMSMASSFAWGAGTHAALVGGTAALGAAGVLATAPVSVPALVGGALVAGLVAIPGFMAGHALKNKYRGSEFGTFHEGDTQDRMVGGALGAVEMIALPGKRTANAVKFGLGAVGGVVGAAAPDLAVDMAGFVAADNIGRQVVKYGTGQALKKGWVDPFTKGQDGLVMQALKGDATAKDVVEKYRADKAFGFLDEAKTLDAAWEDGRQLAREINNARMTAAKVTDRYRPNAGTNPFYKGTHTPNSKLGESGVYGNEGAAGAMDEVMAEELSSDAFAESLTAQAKARIEGVNTRPAYPNIKGKIVGPKGGLTKKNGVIADVPEDVIAQERDVMHFNEFLTEMQDTAASLRTQEAADAAKGFNDAAKAIDDLELPTIKELKQDRPAYEAFKRLFKNNKPITMQQDDSIGKLTFDELERVFAEKSNRELGVRADGIIQEANAFANVVENEGTAAAQRLGTIKSTVISVVKKGSKDPANTTVDALSSAIKDTNNAYGRSGAVDTTQLMDDLHTVGSTSIMDYALKQLSGRQGKKVVAEFSKNKEAFTKALSESNWVKGGAASLMGLAAFMNTPDMEHVDRTLGSLLDSEHSPEVAGAKLQGETWFNNAQHIITAGSKLVDLTALISPGDAHANVASTIGKGLGVKFSEAAATFLKSNFSKEGLTGMVEKVNDGNLAFKDVAESAYTARGARTGYLSTAPQNADQLSATLRSKTNVVPGQGLSTPYFSSNTLFKTEQFGEVFAGNAAVQLAHGQSVVAHHVRQSLKVFNNILRDYAPGVLKEDGSKIAAEMLETQKAYESVAMPLRTYEVAEGKLKEALAEVIKMGKADTKLLADESYLAKVAEKEQALKSMQETISGMKGSFDDASIMLKEKQKEMASKYASARLSLAAEDTLDYQMYPWLKGMLSPEEKQAVALLKDMQLEAKERIVEVMGEKEVLSSPHVKHSRQLTDESLLQMQKLDEQLNELGMDGKQVLAMSKLHSRYKYSQQMIPDIKRNMGEYIPDLEKRLMNADFWKEGKQGGWDYIKNSFVVKNNNDLKSFFDRINESNKPLENTFLRRASEKYASFEAARLLLGLPSAPFKHLFKVIGDMSQLGILNVVSNMPEAAAVTLRNYTRQAASSLAERGLISKDIANNLFSRHKELDNWVSSVINQQGMLDYMTDLERTYVSTDTKNLLSKGLDTVAGMAGSGIKVIESFDRSLTVLTAAKMAQKQGMTGQQAMYGIYDSILKNNFLSGQLNSSWARDPNVRALFLFQNTPFKIWEKRIMNAMITKQDLVTTWGKIKAVDLGKEYEELQGIKKLMKQGEVAWKEGIIQDGIRASKDPFGNPVSAQLMKEMILVGSVIYGGKKLGYDLSGHTMHTPFFRNDEGDPTLSVSPVFKAGFLAAANAKPPGAKQDDYEPEEHWRATTFFKHWYGTSGYSLLMSKVGRINEGDIPEQYKDSKWSFLFSLPKTKDE